MQLAATRLLSQYVCHLSAVFVREFGRLYFTLHPFTQYCRYLLIVHSINVAQDCAQQGLKALAAKAATSLCVKLVRSDLVRTVVAVSSDEWCCNGSVRSGKLCCCGHCPTIRVLVCKDLCKYVYDLTSDLAFDLLLGFSTVLLSCLSLNRSFIWYLIISFILFFI